MCNIDHHITNTYQGYSFANRKFLCTERRQFVVVIHDIFGVKNTLEIFTRQTQPFSALRTNRHHNRLETEVV